MSNAIVSERARLCLLVFSSPCPRFNSLRVGLPNSQYCSSRAFRVSRADTILRLPGCMNRTYWTVPGLKCDVQTSSFSVIWAEIRWWDMIKSFCFLVGNLRGIRCVRVEVALVVVAEPAVRACRPDKSTLRCAETLVRGTLRSMSLCNSAQGARSSCPLRGPLVCGMRGSSRWSIR